MFIWNYKLRICNKILFIQRASYYLLWKKLLSTSRVCFIIFFKYLCFMSSLCFLGVAIRDRFELAASKKMSSRKELISRSVKPNESNVFLSWPVLKVLFFVDFDTNPAVKIDDFVPDDEKILCGEARLCILISLKRLRYFGVYVSFSFNFVSINIGSSDYFGKDFKAALKEVTPSLLWLTIL